MKRLFDIAAVLVMGTVFAVPFLFLLLWIFSSMRGAIFFRQERAGMNGKVIKIVKLRTMENTFDSHGNLLPDADRLTPLGSFLRSSSLDELPSLWNVLTGEMSLVGPRPLLMDYIPLYSAEQARRHLVRPGVTGWAQVNGRNKLSWEQKFALDVWYVDNRTIWLDLKILFLTVRKVMARDGISAAGEATMPRFLGTQIGDKR